MKGRLVAYGDDENDSETESWEGEQQEEQQDQNGIRATGHSGLSASPTKLSRNIPNSTSNTSSNSSSSGNNNANTYTKPPIHERGPDGLSIRGHQSSSTSPSRSTKSSKISGVTSAPKANHSTSRHAAHGIAIRRPPTNHRAQTRAHISSDTLVSNASDRDRTGVVAARAGGASSAKGSTSCSASRASQGQQRLGSAEGSSGTHAGPSPSRSPRGDGGEEDDDMDISPPPTEVGGEEQELSRLREAMRPKDVPGVKDWGIPSEPVGDVDVEVATKLATFLQLKRDPTHPRHFNDSLMSNKAFRNPHLYANLLEWADVDEKVTNFPKDVWDPNALDDEWFAEAVSEGQRKRADKEKEGQKKRSIIDFTSGSASGNLALSNQAYGVGGSGQSKRLNIGASGKPTRWG